MSRFGRGVLAALALAVSAVPGMAWADHRQATTQEVRTVLYYKVADAVLARVLPAGWRPMPFEAGPAKGANLTVNISEQMWAGAAEGGQLADARGRGITLSARVADPKTGENRSMVLWGLTDGSDTPGPYGTHHAAKIVMDRSAHGEDPRHIGVKETWDAGTAAGDKLHLDLGFERGTLTPSHIEQQTRSALHPDFFRIYKMTLLSDVARSAPGGIDRVTRLSLTVEGVPAQILDGSQQLVAVISVPVYSREIWLPD